MRPREYYCEMFLGGLAPLEIGFTDWDVHHFHYNMYRRGLQVLAACALFSKLPTMAMQV